MLSRSSIGAIVTVLSAALLASIATFDGNAQTSYPVICKAGGDMKAEARAGANVRLHFTGGSDAAGNVPPSPGHCAWLDRGFRPGEPTVIAVAGNPAFATYLVESLMRGDTFYAHVYNDGKGAMAVTRVGP